MMPVLIEVAAVDSGGGRRWHFGASPLACQPSRSTESTPRWLTPCIALHIVQTLGLLPTRHQCSTSFFRRATICVYGCRLSLLRYRQAPGWRTSGSLATELSRCEFSSCGAEESPEEVSGVPTSCRTSHQVHQQMHNRNAIGKWDWDVCSEILEIPSIAYPGENVKRARLLWVEHPPAGPSAQCISVQLCRSIQRPGVPEPSTLKTRHRHRKQSASQLSKSPHPTQATLTRPRQQNAPD